MEEYRDKVRYFEMTLDQYVAWAVADTNRTLPVSRRVEEDWLYNWSRTLDAINGVTGIFEVTSLIFSRSEFLGGVYIGKIADTNADDFKRFWDRFFPNEYKEFHNVSGQSKGSDIFNVFRNNILHSGTATAIKSGTGDIIGWRMGYGINPKGQGISFRDQAFHIDCHNFTTEFKKALKDYIAYLRDDTENLSSQGIPSLRWKKGFWYTLKPVYLETDEWVKLGSSAGIF